MGVTFCHLPGAEGPPLVPIPSWSSAVRAVTIVPFPFLCIFPSVPGPNERLSPASPVTFISDAKNRFPPSMVFFSGPPSFFYAFPQSFSSSLLRAALKAWRHLRPISLDAERQATPVPLFFFINPPFFLFVRGYRSRGTSGETPTWPPENGKTPPVGLFFFQFPLCSVWGSFRPRTDVRTWKRNSSPAIV